MKKEESPDELMHDFQLPDQTAESIPMLPQSPNSQPPLKMPPLELETKMKQEPEPDGEPLPQQIHREKPKPKPKQGPKPTNPWAGISNKTKKTERKRKVKGKAI